MPRNAIQDPERSGSKKALAWLPFDPSAQLSCSWPGSILERFKGRVLLQPEAVCAISNLEALNYAELDAASDKLAQQIMECSPGPQRVLSVYADRSPRLLVALLSAIKSGSVFHIIDPKYPLRRIADLLNYLRPAGILNITADDDAKEQLFRFLPSKHPCFWLETTTGANRKSVRSDAVSASPAIPISADSPLYVAFTSGTTGVPKAVWGTHGPVVHFFDWQCKTFEITASDRVSVLSGLAHDPLLRDVLMPLWAGGIACFPPEDVYQVPGRLYTWLRDTRITVIHLTPSLCHLLLNIPKVESPPCLPEVRLAFFGGEKLTSREVVKFQALAPQAVVINCYGATETPQVMSAYVVEARASNISNAANDAPGSSTIPIGRGIDEVQLLLLADSNRLCGAQETGEICVRTPHRAARVEDIAHQPSASLVPNPFSSDPHDLLYRTGDYGKYLEDGTVIVLGRQDQQVKVRGFRVNLSEIEHALEECPGISRFVVDAQPLGENHSLVVFVVPQLDCAFDADLLRRELLDRLPSFMVPDQIVPLKSLPQTPNGKTDHLMLRRILEDHFPSGEGSPTDPGHKHETPEIALISQRLRSLSIVDAQGNVLSMDSLKSVEVACIIEDEFKVRLPVGSLIGYRTRSTLAAEIARMRGQPAEPASPSLGAAAPAGPESAVVPAALEARRKNPSLIPLFEPFGRAITNRLFQIIARVAPDALRVRLHRWRGVRLGYDVSIGYDTIIETAFPRLVKIGNHTNIGMRVTVIGHFRGMEHAAGDEPTVIIDDYAFVGPGVIILPKVTIGEGAVIAAGSVVSASIPPHCFAQGNPARVVAQCGIPLSGEVTYAEFLNRLTPLRLDQSVRQETQMD